MDVNWILLAGAALIAMSFIKKGSDAEKLRILPAGFNWNEGKLYVSVRILNPTNSVYAVNSVVGEVFLKDIPAGLVSVLQKTIIAPNSQQTFHFLVSLNPLYAAKLSGRIVWAVLHKKPVSEALKEARVNLTVNIDGSTVEVNYAIG